MRTTIPTKVKRFVKFVHSKSEKNYGSWIFLPMYQRREYKEFGLCPIRDYLYFRLAEKLQLVHMKYNESNCVLTLKGKKLLEGK